MAGEVDYIALLKCACDLKQRIDELVNKNPEEISAWDVKCTRQEIDKMLKKYFIHTEFNKNSKNYSRTNPKCNNNAEKATKLKTKENLNVLSNNSSENDDTLKNNCGKQNMDDHKKHRNVAKDENNTIKQKCDLHKKCQENLKLYEDYVRELECRLTEVTNFMEKKQRTDQKKHKDTNIDEIISKMNKKENYCRAEIRRLSKELECERKKSDTYHKWADEAFSKIKNLIQTAGQISSYSASLAKSLSQAIVDLPIIVCDDHGDGYQSESLEIKNGKHDDSCCRPKLIAETQKGAESVRYKPESAQNQCCHQRRQHNANRKNRNRNSSLASEQVDYNHSICPRDMTDNKKWTKIDVPQSQPSSNCYRKSGGNDNPEEIQVLYMSENEELLMNDSSYETVSDTSASCTCPNYWYKRTR